MQQKLPSINSCHIASITNGGGPGQLADSHISSQQSEFLINPDAHGKFIP
jgi:hypothetical protein